MSESKPREFYIDAHEHSGHYGRATGRYTAWDRWKTCPFGTIHVIEISALDAVKRECEKAKELLIVERARTLKLVENLKEIQCSQQAWTHTKTREPMTIGEIVQRSFAEYESGNQICDLPKTIL